MHFHRTYLFRALVVWVLCTFQQLLGVGVTFSVQRIGQMTGEWREHPQDGRYFEYYWDGDLSVALNSVPVAVAFGEYFYYAESGDVIRDLTPGQAYQIRIEGGSIESGVVNITAPAGYTVRIGGVDRTQLNYGSSGYPRINETYELLIIAPAAPPLPPPPQPPSPTPPPTSPPAPTPQSVSFTISESGSWYGTTYYDEKNELAFSSGWQGSLTAKLDNNVIGTASSDPAPGNTVGPLPVTLNPGQNYTLTLEPWAIEDGSVSFTWPTGYSIHINGTPQTGITIGAVPGPLTYQLKLVADAPAAPPTPPPPPPPAPAAPLSGHVVNLAVQYQGNGAAGPDLTASLNGLNLGALYGTLGYAPTVLQPGKSYVLNVSGTNLASGEVLLAPPAGFTLWINGVPTTRLVYGAGTFNLPNYEVILLPASGTYSGLVGSASSLQGGSIGWEVSLGSLRNGGSAGSLMLADHGLGTWNIFSPAALAYNATDSEIRIYRESGALRQILANEALVDIVTIDPTTYELRFYPPVSPAATGYQAPVGAAFVTYRVARDGSDTRLRITKTTADLNTPGNPAARIEYTTLERTGSYPAFTWDRTDWTRQNTTPFVRERRVWTALGDGYEELQQLLNSDNTVARQSRHTYPRLGWGVAPVQSVLGDQAANDITTVYKYYTNPDQTATYGQPRYTLSTGGSWTGYDYSNSTDSADGRGLGTIKTTYTPFGSTPAANPDGNLPTANQGVVTTFDYGPDSFGDNRRLTSSQTRINGVLTASTSVSYATTEANGQRLLTATRTESSASNASLVSTTVVYDVAKVPAGPGQLTDAFFRDQVHATTSPAGVRQSYIRHRGQWNASTQVFSGDANGPASRIGVIQGLASPTTGSTALSSVDGYTLETVHVVPGKSTLSYTYRDAAARVVRTESYSWNGSWSLLDWTSFTYNPAGRLTQRATSRGEVEDMEYTGFLLTKTTDATGLVTLYDYDDAGRLKTTTRQGLAASGTYAAQADVVTTTTYDAAGQVTRTELSSPATTEKLISTRAYDRVGRITSETPAGLGTTTTTYDPAARTRTVTAPDGAISISTAYIDGQPASVTGTATVAEYYFYGIEGDGRRWSRRHLAAADSPRWTTTWTDWLGRTVESQEPPYSGSVNRKSTQTYDSRGLLTRSTGPGSHPTLYEYDAFGAPSRTTADFNENGQVDLTGPDRVSTQDTQLIFADGAYWQQTVSSGYLTLGSATPTKLGETRTRLTGYTGTLRDEAWSEDIEGNRTTAKLTVDRAARQVLRTTTAPGLLAPSVEEARNGRPVRSTAPDGITVTTGYDALGRASTTTHVRSGTARTTTLAYHSGTTLPSTVKDPANITTSSTFYDPLGRPIFVADALGRIVRSAYTLRGELAKQWGDATYPVAFEYNAYGERATLRTYQSDAGNQWTAATWPANPGGVVSTSTWEYAPASGGLLRQVDAQGRAVDFTYYLCGKLQSRTWARSVPGGAARVSASYTYEPKTPQIKTVTYNDGTPGLTYGGFTRSGEPTTITDAAGTRTLAYDVNAPWRFTSETLPDLLGGRILRPIYYDGTTNQGGAWGPHTQRAIKGQAWGYRLGNASDASRDLEVLYPVANTGRIAGVHSKAGGGAGGGSDGGLGGYLYTYAPDTRLIESLQLQTVGFAQTRTYDSLRDLPTGIASSWNGATRLSTTTAYNELQQPTRRTQGGSLTTADYGAVLTTDYAYDARHQLTSATTYLGANAAPVATLPGRDFAYGYDAIGNRTSSTARAAEPTRKSDYGVNSLNQYTSRTNKGVAYSGLAAANAKVAVDGRPAQRQGKYFWEEAVFTGDAAVRRVTLAAALIGTGGAVDTAQLDNRYAFFPGSGEAFAYDLDGNLTADGTWTYTYDAENRLIRQEQKPWTILPGAPTAKRLDYTYDYQGRRVRKVVYQWLGAWSQLSDTRFIYQGWNLIAETNASGTLLRSYTWGLDITGDLSASGGVGALVQIVDHAANKRLLPSYDPNGNVATLTNAATGATEAQYEYSPYGELLRASGGYAKSNPFRFSTKYTDDETGLVYYGYRFYDPRNGRFINRDPIDIQGGYNIYAFVNNGPISRWDYLGLDDDSDRPWYRWIFDFFGFSDSNSQPDNNLNQVRGVHELTEALRNGETVTTDDVDAAIKKEMSNGNSGAVFYTTPSGNNAVTFDQPLPRDSGSSNASFYMRGGESESYSGGGSSVPTIDSPSLALVSPNAVPSIAPFLAPAVSAAPKIGTSLITRALTGPLGFISALLTPNTANAPSPIQLNYLSSLETRSAFYLYHYTQPQYVSSIKSLGLWGANPTSGRWGAFATDNPAYTPEGAHQLLAIPSPDAPSVVIPVRVEPGDLYWGPMIVQPTASPLRSGGGNEYIFPAGIPPDRLGTPYPAGNPFGTLP
ncbi:MAG: hypothetical protein NTU80_13280 [Verrucomicrobia bacterium]|nr:hypothetical protein [Verrucomicrobiota bacterium]